MSPSRKIAVLGGGAWGTALAANSRRSGHNVWLYARSAETVAAINDGRKNPDYLGDVVLPEGIQASTDAQAALQQADIVLAVIPAQALGQALAELKDVIPAGAPVVLCSKGIEKTTGRRMSEVARD